MLPIAIAVGDRLMAGCVPIPESGTIDGDPEASWAIDSEADFAPAEVGAKKTVTVCAAPSALIVNGVALTENCPASVPVTEMPETFSAALPVLETVRVFVSVPPTFTLPNAREPDETLKIGAIVPDT